jgi:formylglycine-generating enzyme required for sulfatase activity
MALVAANETRGTAAFYIDQYEASLKQTKKLNSSGVKETVTAAQSRTGSLPANAVNYAEAKAFCEAADKRLCTVDEWISACMGPDNMASGLQTVPTSPSSIDGSCYLNRTGTEVDGITTAPPIKTGGSPKCKTSGLQVYDLIGNVSEWALDEDTNKGLAMGPNAVSKVYNGKCSYYYKTDTDDDKIDDTPLDNSANLETVGFRCCLDSTAGE